MILILLVIYGNILKATEDIRLYDYSNGLSNEKVVSICKDKSGIMWIGTEGGLSQFNGYEFVEIPYFRNQQIRDVYYDSLQNTLWVGSSSGLFLFNVETHVILDASARMTAGEVLKIGSFEGEIIVVFKNGDVLGFGTNGSVRVIFSASLTSFKSWKNEIFNIAFDGNGYLYLMRRKDEREDLMAVQLKTGVYTLIDRISGVEIEDIYSGNGKCIINCDNTRLIFYTHAFPRNLKYISIGEADEADETDEPPGCIQELKGEYLISYKEQYGRYLLKRDKNRLDKIEKTSLNRLLKSRSIHVFYCDEDNVIWAGTEKGLISISPHAVYAFKHIFSDPDKTVSVRQIIAGQRDELFLATYDGIYKYNKKTKMPVLLSNTPKDIDFPLYSRALYYEDGHYVYAGTESNRNFLFRYNIQTDEFETRFFKEERNGVHIGSVFSIIKDSAGIFWLATDVGLASFNPADKLIRVHTNDRFSVGIRRLMYIAHSSSPGKFWACGKGGAFLVDMNDGVLQSYDVSATFGFSDTEYLFATEDSSKNIWLGTQKYGVVVIPSNGREPYVINRSDGLASDEVYSVLWQGGLVAWITTSSGLSRYNIKTRQIQNYLYENGIADDEFNQHSFYQEGDSMMYLGGINGVTYFNPYDFNAEQNKSRIFLANITRWGSENKSKQVSFQINDIVMNPTDYLINLNFGLSDYRYPQGNTFFYKISDLNSNWISLGTENSLTLNGLAPGNYQVRVKGVNKYGMQSSNMLTFSIDVKERFYKTSLFYVLLSIVFITIIYFYFRWRLSRITQRQLLRTQISSTLHDEVGSLLTQIIISTDSAIYSIQNMEEKNKRLSKISSLSRNAVNTMSDVLWSIDSRNDFVGNLTDRMREHAELMLADKGIDLDFQFTNARISKGIDSEVRQQLYLIFKEAIHNIVKHSEASAVRVKFNQEGKKFELSISNNNHNQVHQQAKMMGQGIRNMHMRAGKIKAQCSIRNENGWYTVVIIKD